MTRPTQLDDLGPAAREPVDEILATFRALEDPKMVRPLRRRKPQKPRTKRNEQPEHALQKFVCQELAERLDDRVIWFHIPNAAQRSFRQAGKLAEIGLLPGVPDLVLMWRARDGLREVGWLELKFGKRPTTEAQDEFLLQAKKIGHYAAVCRTVSEVLACLITWDVPQRKPS